MTYRRKRSMPRAKKKEADKRKIHARILMTEAQKRAFELAAAKVEETLSTFGQRAMRDRARALGVPVD